MQPRVAAARSTAISAISAPDQVPDSEASTEHEKHELSTTSTTVWSTTWKHPPHARRLLPPAPQLARIVPYTPTPSPCPASIIPLRPPWPAPSATQTALATPTWFLSFGRLYILGLHALLALLLIQPSATMVFDSKPYPSATSPGWSTGGGGGSASPFAFTCVAQGATADFVSRQLGLPPTWSPTNLSATKPPATGPSAGLGGSGAYLYAKANAPRALGNYFTLTYNGSACPNSGD